MICFQQRKKSTLRKVQRAQEKAHTHSRRKLGVWVSGCQESDSYGNYPLIQPAPAMLSPDTARTD